MDTALPCHGSCWSAHVSGAGQGVGADEMLGPKALTGEAPVIGVANAYAAPGVYSLEVPCPRTRQALSHTAAVCHDPACKLVWV